MQTFSLPKFETYSLKAWYQGCHYFDSYVVAPNSQCYLLAPVVGALRAALLVVALIDMGGLFCLASAGRVATSGSEGNKRCATWHREAKTALQEVVHSLFRELFLLIPLYGAREAARRVQEAHESRVMATKRELKASRLARRALRVKLSELEEKSKAAAKHHDELLRQIAEVEKKNAALTGVLKGQLARTACEQERWPGIVQNHERGSCEDTGRNAGLVAGVPYIDRMRQEAHAEMVKLRQPQPVAQVAPAATVPPVVPEVSVLPGVVSQGTEGQVRPTAPPEASIVSGSSTPPPTAFPTSATDECSATILSPLLGGGVGTSKGAGATVGASSNTPSSTTGATRSRRCPWSSRRRRTGPATMRGPASPQLSPGAKASPGSQSPTAQ